MMRRCSAGPGAISAQMHVSGRLVCLLALYLAVAAAESDSVCAEVYKLDRSRLLQNQLRWREDLCAAETCDWTVEHRRIQHASRAEVHTSSITSPVIVLPEVAMTCSASFEYYNNKAFYRLGNTVMYVLYPHEIDRRPLISLDSDGSNWVVTNFTAVHKSFSIVFETTVRVEPVQLNFTREIHRGSYSVGQFDISCCSEAKCTNFKPMEYKPSPKGFALGDWHFTSIRSPDGSPARTAFFSGEDAAVPESVAMYSTDPLLGIFRRGTCNITFSVAASKLVDGALSVYAIGARRNRTLFSLSANGTANSWQSVQAASLTLRAINETVQVQLAFATRAGGGWGHIFIDDLQISCCRETAMCKEINPLKFRTFPKRWTLGAWKISSGMQDNRSTNVFHSHENSSNPESIASYSTSPLQSAYMRGICNITFSVMASNFVDGALVVYEIATGHNRLLFNMSASQANGTGPNVHRVQSRLCPFRSFSGRMRLQLRFITRAGGGWGDIYIDDMLIVCCRTNATKRPSNSTAAFRIGASPTPGTPASMTPSVATASARVHAKPTASPVHRAEESPAVAATLSKPSHPATQTTPTSTHTPNQTRTHAGNQTSTPTQGRASLRAPAHTKTQSPTQINAQTPAPTRTPAQTQTSMHTPLQTYDQTPLETGDHTPLHTGDHTPTQAGTELVRATPAQGNTSSASSTPPNSPQVGQDASLPSAHAPSPLPHPAHPHANTAGKKTVVPRDAKSSGGHGGNFAELVCGAAALGCL
eukprot:scpid54342/ scgid2331/ 